MLVEELLAKALVGKYLKDYQCLYYITGAQNPEVYGIKIDPEHTRCFVNMEWMGEDVMQLLEAEIITEDEFKEELEKALKQIKNRILNEPIEK